MRSKGITLIALIITIIILLILAGLILGKFNHKKLINSAKDVANKAQNQLDDNDKMAEDIRNSMTAIEGYIITFVVGTTVFLTKKGVETIRFPRQAPVADNKVFEGWYYDAECTKEAKEGTAINQDITLYAKMDNLEKHTITFYDPYNWPNGSDSCVPSVIDTIEAYRCKPTDKKPEDKWLWTCNCKTYNVRYVFYRYNYYYYMEGSNYIFLKENDKLPTDIAANAEFRLMSDFIIKNANFTYYHTGTGINSDGSIQNETKSTEYEAKILDGVYAGEKITNVQILDKHVTTQKYYLIGGEALYYYAGSADAPEQFTVDNNGNLILTEDINENMRTSDCYLHFIIEITTESGKKVKILCNVQLDLNIEIYCIAKGTKITLADRTTKNIEDIEYTDNLLVWDFDNGEFATAKPLWIKKVQKAEEYNHIIFEDGTELNTVADHRVFNMELQKFTYTMNEEDTPIGTKVFKEDGTVTKLIGREVVKKEVEYYNIITDYHMNLFANGILTSLRLNNLYKIENMKFVKDNRELVDKSEFEGIPENYFYGLRLAEQPKEINKGNDVKHTKTLKEYVERILKLAK